MRAALSRSTITELIRVSLGLSCCCRPSYWFVFNEHDECYLKRYILSLHNTPHINLPGDSGGNQRTAVFL